MVDQKLFWYDTNIEQQLQLVLKYNFLILISLQPDVACFLYFKQYYFLVVFNNLIFFLSILMVVIVRTDRNIFSINVELTSSFLLYRGLVHHHHRILNLLYSLFYILWFPGKQKTFLSICQIINRRYCCQNIEFNLNLKCCTVVIKVSFFVGSPVCRFV